MRQLFRIPPKFALAFVSCSVIAISECEAGSSTVERVKIRDFRGVEGYWLDYDVAPKSIHITYGDDFGERDEHVWKSEIEGKHKELQHALQNVPLDQIKDVYEDTSVDDGLQLKFDFRKKDGTTRTIKVNNINQPDLNSLVKVVNSYVPLKYRIVEEWSIEGSGRSGVQSKP